MRTLFRLTVSSHASSSVVPPIILLLALGSASRASAQTTDVIGVRAQGMGGAFTGVADDASASWWNPAGLAGGPLFNGLIEYDRPDTSTSQSVRGFAVAYPALGFTYYRLPIRHIRLSASTETAVNVRQQDEGGLSLFAATVGQSFGNHLVLGSTIKLLHADDTNVSFDVGAMATFGLARLGVVLRDLTQPSFGESPSAFTLERHARAGFALSSGRRGVIGSATLSFDADLTTTHDPMLGDERMIAVGVETWTVKNSVGLRGGFGSNRAGDQGSQVSGGVSVAIRSGSFAEAYVTGGGDRARHGWGLALRVTF